jgi:hypothetical protein
MRCGLGLVETAVESEYEDAEGVPGGDRVD